MCTPQQINAIYNSPNSFPPSMLTRVILGNHLNSEQLVQLETRLDSPHMRAFTLAKTLLQEQQDFDRCMSEEASIDDLDLFINSYGQLAQSNETVAGHYAKVKQAQSAKEADRNLFIQLKDEIARQSEAKSKLSIIADFEAKYPNSAYKNEVNRLRSEIEEEERERAKRAEEQNRFDELKRSVGTYETYEAKMSAINAFLREYPFSSFAKEVEELRGEIEREEKERMRMEDENAWQEVLNILGTMADPEYKKQRLIDYGHHYTLHKSEVPQKMKELETDIEADRIIGGIFKDPSSDVIDFIRLFKRYPLRNKMLRDMILQDMRVNPARYDRVEMNWLVKGKYDSVDQIDPVFTTQEIVGQGVVPLEIMNHITSHPTDGHDRKPEEDEILPEKNFKSEENATDIYFWGVPGSGKSTVLAGLLNLDRIDSLRLKLPTRSPHSGYKYATVLTSYVKENLFPQSTKISFANKRPLRSDDSSRPNLGANPFDNPFVDRSDSPANDTNRNPIGEVSSGGSTDKFIQIIDAILEDNVKQEEHKLCIIEMPGERTLGFAAADAKDPNKMDELLGEGTRELFMNNNRKVFFFVVDPNPQRTYDVEIQGGVKLTQAKALEALIDFFNSVPGLLQKVDAMHVILSKSDMLRNPGDFDGCIKEDVLCDYDGMLADLLKLCEPSKGNVNAHCGHRPYLFTFSLGKIYPGNMNKYDPTDAGNILKVIAANTWSTSNSFTKWQSIVEWMNK